jgi:hypothetical protein
MRQQNNETPHDKFRDTLPVSDFTAKQIERVGKASRQRILDRRASEIRQQLGLPEPAEVAPDIQIDVTKNTAAEMVLALADLLNSRKLKDKIGYNTAEFGQRAATNNDEMPPQNRRRTGET